MPPCGMTELKITGVVGHASCCKELRVKSCNRLSVLSGVRAAARHPTDRQKTLFRNRPGPKPGAVRQSLISCLGNQLRSSASRFPAERHSQASEPLRRRCGRSGRRTCKQPRRDQRLSGWSEPARMLRKRSATRSCLRRSADRQRSAGHGPSQPKQPLRRSCRDPE